MKFSIAAISALLLSSAVSYASADSYADAMKSWCGGLAVTFPTGSTVAVAGSKTKVTVTGPQNDSHQKQITGLDLYSVSSSGKATYVNNIWKGKYALKGTASITDTIPAGTKAGLYYYRVWVTNLVNGQHGPDCLQTSHTFKVTTGSHTNADGLTEYAESLHDNSIYNSEHEKGCFGLEVQYPQAGATFKHKDHIHIQAQRDSASQTEDITKIELYKGDQLVSTAWEGSETVIGAFVLKDHLVLDNIDPSADYHYKVYATSNKEAATCTFESKSFKIASDY